MTADALVTHPALVSVLQAAAQAREQSLAILQLLEDYHSSASREPTLDDELAFSKQQKLLNAHVAYLRGLNRNAIMRVRNTKQETAEARQEIDSLHLELQNLYYEQRHLRGEIAGCESYDHNYLKLPMISSEDYLSLHPEQTESSEHDLTIARIEDEGVARKALHEQKEVLQRRKDALVKETTAKKEELAKLDADLEKWIEGHEAIQKTFEARLPQTTTGSETTMEES